MPKHIEKSELRRRLRRIRAALPARERAAAERAAGHLLKRCIRRGSRYWHHHRSDRGGGSGSRR